MTKHKKPSVFQRHGVGLYSAIAAVSFIGALVFANVAPDMSNAKMAWYVVWLSISIVFGVSVAAAARAAQVKQLERNKCEW